MLLSCRLQEHHRGNKDIVIDRTELKHTVYMYKCVDCVIHVKSKIHSIILGEKSSTGRTGFCVISCHIMSCHVIPSLPNVASLLPLTDAPCEQGERSLFGDGLCRLMCRVSCGLMCGMGVVRASSSSAFSAVATETSMCLLHRFPGEAWLVFL